MVRPGSRKTVERRNQAKGRKRKIQGTHQGDAAAVVEADVGFGGTKLGQLVAETSSDESRQDVVDYSERLGASSSHPAGIESWTR